MHARERHRSKLDAVPSAGRAPSMREVVRSVEAEIVSTVALLRQSTVRVVEAALAWRGGLSAPAPFATALGVSQRRPGAPPAASEAAGGVGTTNYVLHMASDLDDITQLHILQAVRRLLQSVRRLQPPFARVLLRVRLAALDHRAFLGRPVEE